MREGPRACLGSRKIFQAHELLGFLFEVLTQFFGQLVMKLPATEDSLEPAHWRSPLGICGALGGAQHHLDAFEHAIEAGDLALQVAQTGFGDFVHADATIG